MKNILYLVLLLCISNITFADEQAEMELRVAEKVEQVQAMQRFDNLVRERMALAEKEESEPWLISKIYAWGVIVFGSAAIVFCVGAIIVTLWASIKFNYHLFVEFGEFAWIKADTTTRENMRYQIADTVKGLDTKNISEYAWFPALGMSFLASAVVLIGVAIWPVVAVIVGPQGVINLIAFRKRKKRIFQKKLKGEMTNESV